MVCEGGTARFGTAEALLTVWKVDLLLHHRVVVSLVLSSCDKLCQMLEAKLISRVTISRRNVVVTRCRLLNLAKRVLS